MFTGLKCIIQKSVSCQHPLDCSVGISILIVIIKTHVSHLHIRTEVCEIDNFLNTHSYEVRLLSSLTGSSERAPKNISSSLKGYLSFEFFLGHKISARKVLVQVLSTKVQNTEIEYIHVLYILFFSAHSCSLACYGRDDIRVKQLSAPAPQNFLFYLVILNVHLDPANSFSTGYIEVFFVFHKISKQRASTVVISR